MGIKRISAQDSGNSSAATSVSAVYPGATTQGNLLIATVGHGVNGNTATIPGWTLVLELAFNSSQDWVGILSKSADGTEDTITASATGANIMDIMIFEVKNNNGMNTDANSSTLDAASASTASVPAFSTTQPDTFIVQAIWFGGTTTAYTIDSGYTNAHDLLYTNRLRTGLKTKSPTGSESPTASWTTNRASGSVIIPFLGTQGKGAGMMVSE